MTTKVSVIIPCYNYARYLTDAVESVVQQTFQDFEIIIVNDGSTDDTRSVAEALIQKHKDHYITLINQPNSGQPAISRNNGIRVAKGRYILCLDADDKISPYMLEECVKLLDENPDVAIAYTDRLDFDGVEQVVYAGDYNFEKLKYENHISYCALYRKEVWEKVGGYRDNVSGFEDWDFWIAAGAKGFKGKRIPKPLFMYRRHDTGLFKNSLKNIDIMKAQIVVNNAECFTNSDIEVAKRILGQTQSDVNYLAPAVSVVLPTYNRPQSLQKALESLSKQTFTNFEVIVVNDGGVDVRSIVNQFSSDKKFLYLSHSINKGLPSARNTAIKISRGKYIAYLDDDDIFYPNHLQTLFDFLENTDYKIAYTDAYRAIYKNIEGKNVLKCKEIFSPSDFDNERILVENFIPVICVMHEKSCFDEVGLFDETLTSHEDWELWIRMSKKFSFGHIPKPTCEFSWIEDDLLESKKRIEFLSTLLRIYNKYKNEAENNPNVLKAREDKINNSLTWAYKHINLLETDRFKLKEQITQRDIELTELKRTIEALQDNINKLNQNINSLNARLTAIQNNLSWRILNRYVFGLWDKWIIPFGSKRRAILEKFFWKKLQSSNSGKTFSDSTSSASEEKQIRKSVIIKSKHILDVKRFIVYSSSQGNYFFHEIRDLIADGIRELGYKVEVKNETNWLCEDDAWHIVVAPHEFFYLGDLSKSATQILPENLIIVNSEQPSTKWATLSENYFPLAKYIWDINYDSTKRLTKQGINVKFLPLGFVPDCYLFKDIKRLPENYATCYLNKIIKNTSFLDQPFNKRPIDISFVGALTPRREEFFSATAKFTSKYKSFIHLSDGLTAPIIPGITTHLNTDTVVGIMQRSKISLNIHHGSDKYFEWHRIVLLGIAQKTLVVSEPSVSSPIFQPGIHYVETELKDIPEVLEYYLATPVGNKDAERIIEEAYKKFVVECKMSNYLKPLVKTLYENSGT